MSRLVYLAGPITGCSFGACVDWRREAIEALARDGIEGISPMRWKQYLAAEASVADCYDQHVMSSQRAITTRDRFDALRCDVMLSNLTGAPRVSIGTMIEYGWADGARKPIVTVIEPGNVHDHAMLRDCSGWLVPDLATGLDVVRMLLK